MNILVSVNQAAMLRKGIDAPNSTVTVGIDPSTLSQEYRDILADTLREGYKALDICISTPGIEGVIEWMDKKITEARLQEERIARYKAREEKTIAEILADQKMVEIVTGLNSEGKHNYPYVVSTKVLVPEISKTGSYFSFASPESKLKLDNHIDALKQARAKIIEAEMPELRARWQAWREERQAAIRKEREAWTALYNRIPETLRERAEAGFATDEQVTHAMAFISCADHGLPYHTFYCSWREAETLTDAEFALLKEARAKHPDIEVTAARLYETCEATESDNPDDIDGCGQVEVDCGLALVFSWNVGKLHICTFQVIS